MKIRKTPLFYVVLLISVICVPFGIYGLILSGWAGLVGLLAFICTFASVVALVLEQLLLRFLQPGLLGVIFLDMALLAGVVAVIFPILA